MIDIKERYVIDEKGRRTGVIINIKDYKRILDELEELESIRAYDSAKSSGDKVLPFEDAVKEIGHRRDIYRLKYRTTNPILHSVSLH